MGSKPLKQNLDVAVSKRSSGQQIARNINQRANVDARAELAANSALIKQLKESIAINDLEKSALREEVEKLRQQLKSISKKSTGDVIKSDLELKNKSSLAKKSPRSKQ